MEIKTLVPVPAWVDAMQARSGVTDTARAYGFVPLIYRATQLRCNSLLRVPYHLYAVNDEQRTNELDWMYPDLPLNDLLWLTQAALLLAGASYVVKLSNAFGIGKGLQWLNPYTMRVEARDGQRVFIQNTTPPKTWTQDEMIYTREFHPSDDIGAGIGAADVALQAAKLNMNVSAFAANFFQHGAMPITTVSVVGALPKSEQERIQNFFRRATQGVKNAFRVLAVGNDVKIQTTQNPLSELATPELNDAARKDIARAFGLPVTMLDSDENYATASQHATTYLIDTVIPAATRIADALNRQLMQPLGYVLEFTPEEMTEFQRDETERATSAVTLNTLLNDAPTIEQFKLVTSVLGYDFTEQEEMLIATVYASKAQRRADMQARTQPNAASTMQSDNMPDAQPMMQDAEQKTIERAQYRKYIKKGKDPQAFVFKQLTPCEQQDLKMELELELEINEAQTNGDTSSDPFSSNIARTKSVEAVTRQFCARLRKLIHDFWRDNELDPNIDLNTELRALVEYHVSAAYFEGLQAGGVSPEDFDADMSAEADTLVLTQLEYVPDFMHAIEDALGDKGKQAAVMVRAELWCNSVAAAGQQGLNAARGAEMVIWRLGATEEHCDTCAWLDGQRHRRRWFTKHGYIPRQPGSETLECGGWNCDCELVPVTK